MAMLNCSFDRLLLKVLYVLCVLAVCLPFCLSAVENCRPCGPGKYCSKFFGICLACKDYCPGESDCPSACTPIKPNLTTFAPTTTGPTSIKVQTTSQSMTTSTSSGASDVVGQQSTNANIPSGGDNILSDNGKEDSELPAWLSVGLLITLCIIVLLIFVCRKYCNTLKMQSICCFFSGDSGNRTSIRETRSTMRMNPIAKQPLGCHQTTGGYTAVQVDGVDSNDIINQPGPSKPNSSRPSRPPRPNAEATAPADPTHSASGSRNYTTFTPTTTGPTSIQIHTTSQSMATSTSSGASAVVVQSASVHLTENPLRERETPQRACPSDRRSSPKRTPDILRKITDGTHKGHVISTGASPFNPPNGMCEDIQWERHSGHGD